MPALNQIRLLSRLLDKTLYDTDPDAAMNRVLPYDLTLVPGLRGLRPDDVLGLAVMVRLLSRRSLTDEPTPPRKRKYGFIGTADGGSVRSINLGVL
jgi:hypothetical protein